MKLKFYPEIILIALLCILAVAAGYVVVYPPHVKPPTSLATTPPRLPGTFRFDPKPDMTNYELALSISIMFGGLDYFESIRPTYDAMPPEVKRHWLPPEPKK